MPLKCPNCGGRHVSYVRIFQYVCERGHNWEEEVGPAPEERHSREDATAPPPDAPKMPFGKHKGTPISELPTDYINWCLENIENLSASLQKEMENQLVLRRGGGVVRKDTPAQPDQPRAKFTGTKVKL